MRDIIQDYHITILTDLVNNCLNPKHQKDIIWTRRYLVFHSVIYYFEYAVAMVQTQERALIEKLSDPIICGSAVSAYANMGACLKLLNKELKDFTEPDLKSVIENYSEKIKRITDLRDRISAHPYEDEKQNVKREKFLISKRSGYCSDGKVFIRQVSYDPALNSQSKIFELTPRVDLENLRSYLFDLSIILKQIWS